MKRTTPMKRSGFKPSKPAKKLDASMAEFDNLEMLVAATDGTVRQAAAGGTVTTRPEPAREPSQHIVARRTPIAAVMRMVHGPIHAAPKFTYVRSPEILAACRTLPCQVCFRGRGVVAAHSNWAVHGKGRSIKASDVFVAAMCHECHHELDQGAHLLEADRQAVWWVAHANTVKLLCTRKLWPADVPVPDVLTYPFPIGLPAADIKALAQP